jgi:hypothetical protein
MRKLIIIIFLLLFSINSTTAMSPTKLPVIEGFVPVILPTHSARPSVPNLKPPVVAVYTKTVAGAKAMALDMLGKRQFACLDNLFTRESHWNPYAQNKSSGAYGIPQALPGSKMSSEGSDWRTNPLTQVKWGIKYVESRYGSACGAWRHSELNGWY